MNYHYLPYASGLLQAYVLRHSSRVGRFIFLPFVFDRLPLEIHLASIRMADVLAFSAYGWNLEYSLALARAAKVQNPHVLTIFGGPQIPKDSESFLRQHPEVDICCHGEGEVTFLKLLESLPACHWEEIFGISYLDSYSRYHHQAASERIQDLNQIPSPYLMGLYDDLLKRYPYQWVAPWESNRGCPFACTFCDWGSATQSKVRFFDLDRLKQEFQWFANHKIDIVNCNDANFGMFKRDIEIAEMCADVKKQTGYPHILFVQGSKNMNETVYQAQKTLIDAGLCELMTMDLLSTTEQALERVERENTSWPDFKYWQQRMQQDGVKSYTNLMIGLPGESYESFAESMNAVITQGQHHLIHFFNSYVLPNARGTLVDYQVQHGIETVKAPYYEPTHPLHSEIQEWQQIVIATATMPHEDWVRCRVLAWWIEILYLLRKPMQLPILMIHRLGHLSFRQMFEFYAQNEFKNYSILSALQAFLYQKAHAIQQGQYEACALNSGPNPQWLTVPDFVSAGLQSTEMQKTFYQEQYRFLQDLVSQYQIVLPKGLLEESIGLSAALFKSFVQHQPFKKTLNYNLWEWTQSYLKGQEIPLETGLFEYVHDWLGPPFYELKNRKYQAMKKVQIS